jgi:aspartyl-tRNA(Asn)/glutamyl-tRNA(Gln) amidotransferase subunit A
MKTTNLTVLKIRDMLDKGEVTSRQIVESYLERIESVNPEINAYLYVAKAEALEEADIKDEERREGRAKGILHGIPISVKDNMSVIGMQNTCASKFLEGYIAPYDATVIEKIKNAGGIILGKLNMDEFAMGSTTEYSAFGPTLNPWDKERIPGGSSGGSATAVSAGMAPISLGSDTGGSVRQPAAFNNLVGLKPTYGRISRYGVTAFGSTLDQVGILGKNVKDTAVLAGVLSGADGRDFTTKEVAVPDYLAQIKGDLKNVRLALPRDFFNEGLNPLIKDKIMEAVEEFKRLGATVDEIDLPMAHYSLAVYYIVSSAEASSNLARFDGIRYGKRSGAVDSNMDLYKSSRSDGFGEEVKRRIMLGTYVLSAGYYDAYYNTALKVRTLIKADFQRIFAGYDAIIGPTTTNLPSRLGEKPDNVMEVYLNDLYTVPASIAGLPAIAFPVGFIGQLPVSMQIIGDYFSEAKLFDIIYGYEREHDFTERTPGEDN